MENKKLYTRKLKCQERALQALNDSIAYANSEIRLAKEKLDDAYTPYWEQKRCIEREVSLIRFRQNCYQERTKCRSQIENYKNLLAELD